MSVLFRLLSKVPDRIAVTTKYGSAFPHGYIMSAWQCLRFLEPGNEKITQELHRTNTRRIPILNRPDQLLIKVSTASLNPIDFLLMYGYGSTTFQTARWLNSTCTPSTPAELDSEFPLTPGRDFSGRVMDFGPSSMIRSSRSLDGPQRDQRVAGATLPYMSSSGSGSLAEYIICSASDVALLPDGVSEEEATAVGYAGLTAWSALVTGGLNPFHIGRLNHDLSNSPLVLIAGASGGVGLIASQLAKLCGARVHVTCPNDTKAQTMMKELDIEEVIVYPDQPPVGTKYDIIIDCIRPSPLSQFHSTSDRNFRSLASLSFPTPPPLLDYLQPNCSARYVSLNPPILTLIDQLGFVVGGSISFAQLASMQILPWLASMGNRQSQYRWAFFQPNGRRLAHLLKLIESGQLKVYLDSVFPFDQVPEAFVKLRNRGVRGKIVVRVEK